MQCQRSREKKIVSGTLLATNRRMRAMSAVQGEKNNSNDISSNCRENVCNASGLEKKKTVPMTLPATKERICAMSTVQGEKNSSRYASSNQQENVCNVSGPEIKK